MADKNIKERETYVATIKYPDELESSILLVKPEVVYRLSEFEGPIDLLLTLIKDSKINIEEIFVSDVTSQYVKIITTTAKEDLDFEYAGEFITLAAELVYIKSLRTLPQEDYDFDIDDPEIQRLELIQKIQEYAIMKEKSEKLREVETINRFYREPVFSEKDYRVALVNFSLPKLIDAFARVLVNADRVAQEITPKKVMKDKFSVHDQMVSIAKIVKLYKKMNFIELFEPDFDRSDIVTTFLAILELLKYARITAIQDEHYGDITVFYVEGSEDIDIGEEFSGNGEY